MTAVPYVIHPCAQTARLWPFRSCVDCLAFDPWVAKDLGFGNQPLEVRKVLISTILVFSDTTPEKIPPLLPVVFEIVG